MTIEYVEPENYPEKPNPEEKSTLQTSRATYAERDTTKTMSRNESEKSHIGISVLLAKAQYFASRMKWPAFTSGFYGPCIVVNGIHPRYYFNSGHILHTRYQIHAHSLLKYYP